ncbi:hypothetical protein JCM3770_002761 [Rhodotorula araucariae]
MNFLQDCPRCVFRQCLREFIKLSDVLGQDDPYGAILPPQLLLFLARLIERHGVGGRGGVGRKALWVVTHYLLFNKVFVWNLSYSSFSKHTALPDTLNLDKMDPEVSKAWDTFLKSKLTDDKNKTAGFEPPEQGLVRKVFTGLETVSEFDYEKAVATAVWKDGVAETLEPYWFACCLFIEQKLIAEQMSFDSFMCSLNKFWNGENRVADQTKTRGPNWKKEEATDWLQFVSPLLKLQFTLHD